jgi:flagellar biogenesis protein FliO
MGPLWSTTLALAVMCALALGALRALGRRGGGAPRGLRVVGRLPLETRRTLYVVEAAGRTLLVGVGDGPMTVLAELDPTRLEAPAAAPSTGLVAALRRVVGA